MGNTRLTFTTKPKTIEFTGRFESETAAEEEELFSNLKETREAFNSADATASDIHVTGDDEVVMLNNSQIAGPAISLPVGPGDVIDMEVYSYYEAGDYGNLQPADAILAAVAGAFGGANGGNTFEQSTYDAFTADNGTSLVGNGNDAGGTRPAAYLNYILFDEQMNFQKDGFAQVGTNANTHKVLALNDIVVEKAGFIYIYLSNESNSSSRVFFDDMKVVLTESNVVQKDDYRPFGLTFNSYQRVTGKNNDYLYNGKEKIDALDLGWYDYGARMYMSEIGRWNAVDPLAEKYIGLSPYNYVANIPTRLVDPDGMRIDWNTDNRQQRRQIKRQIRQARKSEAFNTIWKELKKSDNLYVISATKKTDAVVSDAGAKFAPNFGEVTNIELAPGDIQTFEINAPGETGGNIFINTDVVNFSKGDETMSQYLQNQLIEEVVHAGQFENLSNGTPFINESQGFLNLEFEGKTIAGMIQGQLGTLGKVEDAPWDKIPHGYGNNGGRPFGKAQLTQYDLKFRDWLKEIDKNKNGYGGFRSDTPHGVTNSSPLLLIKLIK